MYSMVLMMALSTGAGEPVHFFSGSCHGGYTGAACNGAACHGGGFLFGKGCHGGAACHGNGFLFGKGCHGGAACNGAACHGGFLFGGKGCHGGGFLFGRGCHGACHGGGACMGGKIEVVPVKPGEKEPPKEISNQATIVVTIPAGAKLSIDNNPTSSTANVRTFVSPALEPGKEYVYTLKAEIAIEGKIETVVKEITVRANETTRVNFEASSVAAVNR